MRSIKNDDNGSTLLIVLIIALIIVIAGAVGYYVWQNNNKKSSDSSTTVTTPQTTFLMNTSPLLGGACSYRTIISSGETGICINQEDAEQIINDNQAQITQAQNANPNSQVLASVTATVSYSTKDIAAGVYPGAKTVSTKFLNIEKLDKVSIETKSNQ